jgi:hypothetical protein
MKSISDGLELNFDKKDVGQASTSKYIQAQIPDVKGIYQTKEISGTPDDKIINTGLVKTFCQTVALKTQSLFGIPLPLPFLKSKLKDKIEEVPLDKEKLQYGKTFVTETKGGFVELKSETPKSKIWQWLHPAGTYRRWTDDGSSYDKVVGDTFFIFNKNWNISVGIDFIEVVQGNNKIQIVKNSITNINGDSSLNIDGNSISNIGKDCGIQVKGNKTETISKDCTETIYGGLTENVYKDHNTQVNGNESNTILKNKNDVVCGSLNILVTGDVNISSQGNLNITGKTVSISGETVSING